MAVRKYVGEEAAARMARAVKALLPQPSSSTPPPDGTASAGSSAAYARADHAHPAARAHVDLNGEWGVSSDGAPAGATAVFRSESNWNASNGAARCKVTFTGVAEFTIMCRSNGEGNYDYLELSQLDAASITRAASGNYKSFKGAASASAWTAVTYTGLDPASTHSVWLLYSKDGSTNSGEDRGFFCIPGAAVTVGGFASGSAVELPLPIADGGTGKTTAADAWTALGGGTVGKLNHGSGTTTYLRNDGTWATPATSYSLPLAASGTRGGIQVGYSQSGKNYPVQLSGEKAYVNVPWENTTYTAATASANGLMSSADKSKLDACNDWHGTCATAAGTAAKAVTCAGFSLSAGAKVRVRASYANTYSSGAITLNVNSTGAKTVYVNGQATSSANRLPWAAGAVLEFTYDGSCWVFSGGGTAPALAAYPVGSIYMSVNSTSPATLFGGTWERLSGRFLLGATDDGGTGADLQSTASVAAGGSGGEEAHTLTTGQMPSHTHTQNAHSHGTGDSSHPSFTTVNTAASRTRVTKGTSNASYVWLSATQSDLSSRTATESVTASSQNTGGGEAHNNMPPFLSVYMWKRTA